MVSVELERLVDQRLADPSFLQAHGRVSPEVIKSFRDRLLLLPDPESTILRILNSGVQITIADPDYLKAQGLDPDKYPGGFAQQDRTFSDGRPGVFFNAENFTLNSFFHETGHVLDGGPLDFMTYESARSPAFRAAVDKLAELHPEYYEQFANNYSAQGNAMYAEVSARLFAQYQEHKISHGALVADQHMSKKYAEAWSAFKTDVIPEVGIEVQKVRGIKALNHSSLDSVPKTDKAAESIENIAKRAGFIGGVVLGSAAGIAAKFSGASWAQATRTVFESAMPYGETATDLAIDGDTDAAARSATIETASNGASIAGAVGGAVAGAAIGSFVPVVGTVIGGVVGGIVGSFGVGYAAAEVTEIVYDGVIDDEPSATIPRAASASRGVDDATLRTAFTQEAVDAFRVHQGQVASLGVADVSANSGHRTTFYTAYQGDAALGQAAVKAGVPAEISGGLGTKTNNTTLQAALSRHAIPSSLTSST